MDLGADVQALDGDGDAVRDVGGLGLDQDVRVLDHDQGLADGLALDVHGDLDLDLLATLHDHQVDVLDGVLDRVALDLLRQRQQALAALDLDQQQGVRGLQRQHGVVTWQRDVHRVRAVAVQNGGHLVVPADSAGSTLAELRARLGLDLDLGHEMNSLKSVAVICCRLLASAGTS